MGTRHARPRPKHLAAKLLQIRRSSGFTLEEMAQWLKNVKKSPPTKSDVYRFESGTREPSLLVLLEYSRVARVSLEALVDDNKELPERLAFTVRSKRSRKLR